LRCCRCRGGLNGGYRRIRGGLLRDGNGTVCEKEKRTEQRRARGKTLHERLRFLFGVEPGGATLLEDPLKFVCEPLLLNVPGDSCGIG
jgi:hypothetical protein